MQDIRKFMELAAGCNTDDYIAVAPPAATMESYSEAVANSCTDTYTTGKVPAKAQGTYCPCPCLACAGYFDWMFVLAVAFERGGSMWLTMVVVHSRLRPGPDGGRRPVGTLNGHKGCVPKNSIG